MTEIKRVTDPASRLFVCPCCGTRDEAEFRYGGEPAISRPPQAASDGVWSDYLYTRENRRGVAREYWVHTQGCGLWLIIERDTLTHTIHSVEEAAL